MVKKYLEVGQVVGTHGVRGEMRVNPWCDSPEFMKQFKHFYLNKEGTEALKVISCRPHGNIALLKVEGIDSIEAVNKIMRKVLYMDRAEANLSEGENFIQDLIDCTVFDADTGIIYGKLTDVMETGANDVWQITDDNGREYLIPAIKEVVSETDVENGIIKIRPMKGIFDDAH